MNIDIFQINFCWSHWVVLVYSNQDLKLQDIAYQKKFLIIITSSTRKTFMTKQLSHRKWYEEIRKLATGQGEDYTTGCLLDYDYIKNHYKLVTVDLSRQKELDADPKAI